jgi:polyisoprenyl-teichoic acid--peptidoglycan teichoic acid transferase
LGIIVAEKSNVPKEHSRPPLWLRFSIGLFMVVFVAGGLYSGYLFYATVREIVAHADLPSLPVVQLPAVRAPEVIAEEAAHQPEPLPVLPEMTAVVGGNELVYQPPAAPASAEDRINILLAGIDRRNGESWAHLTDTMIVVTIDSENKEAGMMSIPRDLYLTIPGVGEDRINTANSKGYQIKYPGGGPSLLKHTLETNFGIPIDYYIMIDFAGFVKVVDTLGGIEVNVPKTLHDTMFPVPKPGDPHAYGTVHFDAGSQHMSGERALPYARSRMSTSDFDRADRQQRILLAIREKALNINILPKLPSLAATMGNMVKTDMTLEEMIELAALGPQIDMSNIRQLVIQKPMVYGYRTPKGAAVQLPKWDLIHAAVADMFYSDAVAPAATATPAPPTPTPTLAPADIEGLARLAEEGARIAVQNGTSEPNFAARVAAILMEQGYQVVEFGDADRLDYPATVVVDYTGKTFTLEKLIEHFRVTPENVRRSPNLRSQVDIRIVVGQDFLLTLP